MAELTKQQKVFTLGGVLLGMFLAALDQTVVATAGPRIQQDLNMDPSLYTWITTAYLLASTVLVPVYGKLSDLYGRRIIVIIGIVIFLTASALCGWSTTSGQLIAARALQGIGSASLFTTAFAVVADIFSPAERGRYTGMFGAVFGVSSLIGPLLGGFITDNFSWHWVFFINMPIGAIALAFIFAKMPALKPVRDSRPRVDILGAVLLAIGVVPFLLAASFGRTELRPGDSGFLWLSPQMLGLSLTSLVGVIAFIAWEKRAAEPLIDLKLFSIPMFAWGVATVFVLGAVFLVPMIFLPLFMVNVVGVTNTASGLTISPLVLGIVAGNVTSGQLVSRVGKYKPFMLGAIAILTLALAVMAFTLTPTSTQGEVTLKMILLGIGLGPSIPLYTLAIQNAAPVQNIGVATSMSTFFRQMGSTVGIAVAGSLFASTLSSQMKVHLAEATKELPPALVQKFLERQQKAGSGSGDGPPAKVDPVVLKQQVGDQLEGARNIAARAIRGETLAISLVESNPLASEQLRATAKNGGAREQVRRSYEGNWKRIELEAARPATWTSFLNSREAPASVLAELRQIAPEQLVVETSRAALLAPIRLKFFAGQQQAEERALSQQLGATDAYFSALGPKVSKAIDDSAAAVKQSFTDSVTSVFKVAILLAILAFALTLKLPQLPLRRTSGMASAPPPAE